MTGEAPGTQGNAASEYVSISGDGRVVAFESAASNLVPGDANQEPDVFVHDRLTHAMARVSVSTAGVQGNEHSSAPSISAAAPSEGGGVARAGGRE